MVEVYILFVILLVGAVVAIESNDLLSSVISVSAVGLGLCMMFLVLKAPDVAFTQLIVEILCLIILIRGTIRKDLPFSTSGRWVFNTIITASFIVAVLVFSFKTIGELPSFGSPLMRVSQHYLEKGFAETGSANLVSAILMNYRSWDRLGELGVIFVAVLGSLAILRRNGNSLYDGRKKEGSLSLTEREDD